MFDIKHFKLRKSRLGIKGNSGIDDYSTKLERTFHKVCMIFAHHVKMQKNPDYTGYYKKAPGISRAHINLLNWKTLFHIQ